MNVPLLLTLTCCGALGLPFSDALQPILVTNGYIILSWLAHFLPLKPRLLVIAATFLGYAWASHRRSELPSRLRYLS